LGRFVSSPASEVEGKFGEIFISQGNRFAFLVVSEGGTAQAAEAFLFYFVSKCGELGCAPIEEGSGPIPAADLSGGPAHLRLRTNTSAAANSGFVHTSGSGGPVEVHWNGNEMFFSRFSNSSTTKFGNTLVRSRQSGTSASAVAEGSIVGFAVTRGNAFGIFGTSSSRELVIESHP